MIGGWTTWQRSESSHATIETRPGPRRPSAARRRPRRRRGRRCRRRSRSAPRDPTGARGSPGRRSPACSRSGRPGREPEVARRLLEGPRAHRAVHEADRGRRRVRSVMAERGQVAHQLDDGCMLVVPDDEERSSSGPPTTTAGSPSSASASIAGVVLSEVEQEHAVDPVLRPPAPVDLDLALEVGRELEGQRDRARGKLGLDAREELMKKPSTASMRAGRARTRPQAFARAAESDPCGPVRTPAELSAIARMRSGSRPRPPVVRSARRRPRPSRHRPHEAMSLIVTLRPGCGELAIATLYRLRRLR